MTVALLMENVLTSAIRHFEQARARKVTPLPLDIKPKVPSDIVIAMAHTPKPVTQLAREIGLLPDELESYGKYKAKVELSVLDRLAHRKDGKYIVISGWVFSTCTMLGADDRSASLPHHLVRVSQPRPSALHRLWVHTLVDLHLLASVNPVKDLPLVSRVVLPVGVTVRLFRWTK